MYIVGIDIAKRKHEAAVIDGEGTVIIKPFSFTNNCSGYNRLLAMLTKAKLPLDEVSFAMEATGHYWLALFTRLQKEGFRVQVINPVQTNSIRSFYILAKINDGLLSSNRPNNHKVGRALCFCKFLHYANQPVKIWQI